MAWKLLFIEFKFREPTQPFKKSNKLRIRSKDLINKLNVDNSVNLPIQIFMKIHVLLKIKFCMVGEVASIFRHGISLQILLESTIT